LTDSQRVDLNVIFRANRQKNARKVRIPHIARGTVIEAYEQLLAEGFLESKREREHMSRKP
jgi:hypothetical protein